MSELSSNAAKLAKAAASDLEGRLEALRAEMDDVLKSLSGKAAGAGDYAEGAAEKILDELREALTEIKSQVGAAEKTVVKQTREHPVQSLLVAFGVGYLISLMMRR